MPERHHLNELFESHQPRLQAWCRRLTGDPADAADLAQEVCLRAWQRLDTFRGQAKFGSWLCSIARNLHIDNIRAKAARGETAIINEEAAGAADCDLYGIVECRDALRRMDAAIRESLSEMERRVLVLHFSHEIPLAHITKMLKLTNRSGAKAYLAGARRKLARHQGRRISMSRGIARPNRLQLH